MLTGRTENCHFDGVQNFNDEFRLLKENPNAHMQNSFFDSTTALTSFQQPTGGKEKPRRGTQYMAAIITTIAGFVVGTSLGWTSPAGPMMLNNQYGFRVTDENVSWIAALMPLGAMVGCPIMAGTVDKMGRKKMMALLTVPTLVGWGTIIWAESVPWIYAGRVLIGFASGSYTVIVPLYTSEIAENEIRGTLGTYFQLQIFLGVLYTYAMGSYCSVFGLSSACAMVPVMFVALLVLIPESPLYYLMHGDAENAESTLKFFRDGSAANSVDAELDSMRAALAKTERERISFVKALQTAPAVRGLVVGLGLMVFQQFTGCNAVIFYATTIFNATGSAMQPNTSAVIVGAIALKSTYFSTLVVDRLGRRILLMVSIVTIGVSTFIIGAYFYAKESNYDVSSVGFIPLLSLCLFIIFFSVGFGPIPWMMIGELFPLQIKDVTSSIVCMANWFFVFLVTKFFTSLVSAIYIYNTFFLFTAFSVLGTFFVWFIVPETKGKTMEEIQVMLGA